MMDGITVQAEPKGISLPPQMNNAIQEWSNSMFRPSIPTNLIVKSIVTEVKSERAKMLIAQFFYGERNGTEKEIPYDDSGITNRVDCIEEESLWLYGDGWSAAPSGFSEKTVDTFRVQTGKTKKCPKCRGDGKIGCRFCNGTGLDKSQNCAHCSGKGCRYCGGSGNAKKDCPFCSGSGKKQCGNCIGYRYVETVIEVKTRFRLESIEELDCQSEVPPSKLKKTTGTILFEQTIGYPENEMKPMIKGGFSRQEYVSLQSNRAALFHTLITEKLHVYDGDLNRVHEFVDRFFKKISGAFQDNRVLQHEILPMRLRIEVEDVSVKRVAYLYKNKPYTLWVYGNERRIFAHKKPLGLTRRLVIHWIIQLTIVSVIVHRCVRSRDKHLSDNRKSTNIVHPTKTDPYEDIRNAAQNGDSDAETRLGLLYSHGESVAKNPTEAITWLTRGATQGSALAQDNLGAIYYKGDGVAKDNVVAMSWFTKAAKQGNADAQFNLGVIYFDENGIEKNPIVAFAWFTKAAEQGHLEAQKNMGDMYFNGSVIPKDYIQSAKWFSLAAAQGSNLAKDKYIGVTNLMTAEQIEQAKQLINEFVPRIDTR